MTVDVGAWAGRLLDAEARREAMAPITDTAPDLTLDEAYEIQSTIIGRKLAAGEKLVGAKLGLTSRAKQEAMGVHEPLYAWLTDTMALPAEAPLVLSELIHPRVEPEIVFVLGNDLAGPGVTAQDALDATATVCCGLEVIDSRYEDFRFTLADVVADNASSSRFVLGSQRVDPSRLDLALVDCVLEDGAEQVATATGAAVMGNPAEAVALLANFLGRRGQRLEKGWIVLSGGLTAPVPLHDGSTVAATFGHLGRVEVRACR